MEIKGWKYYNHAIIPVCAPHEHADIKMLQNKEIWKLGGHAFLARWTSDFDCGYETNWWYVIKDTPFEVGQLKAKRRYEITKGKKYFEVKRINPHQYMKEMFEIASAVFKTYPLKYRPSIDEQTFCRTVEEAKNIIAYAAFDKERKMCAYAWVEMYHSYAELCVLKADINSEKYGVNAAMLACILEDFEERLKEPEFYICDGARNILHETSFQDYLEKYFGFRRAYCILHIRYRFLFGFIIKVLYPFRSMIRGKGKIAGKISAVLKMEEIRKSTWNKERM